MKNLPLGLLCAALALPLLGCAATLNEGERTDPGIRARVEAALQSQNHLDLSHVDVDVHSRIVTVTGIVATWEDKQLIEKLVRGTRGIDQALFNLVIQE